MDDQEKHGRWRHHHKHPLRQSRFVDVIIIDYTSYKTKEEHMSTVTLIDGQAVVATLGSVRDANGQVTPDTIASAVWTNSDTTLGTTLVASTDTFSATLTVPKGVQTGTVTISVSATTASGATVTGSGVATINAPAVGAPVTVDITWGTPA